MDKKRLSEIVEFLNMVGKEKDILSIRENQIHMNERPFFDLFDRSNKDTKRHLEYNEFSVHAGSIKIFCLVKKEIPVSSVLSSPVYVEL